MKRVLPVLVGCLGLAACQQGGGVDVEGKFPVALAMPEKVACAALDAGAGSLRCRDIKAAMFVSGYMQPGSGGCELTVNPSTCEVSGECPAVAPAQRRFAMDYYTVLDGGPRGRIRMVLAQAFKDVDLRNAGSEGVDITFTEADLVNRTGCEDLMGCDNTNSNCAAVQDLAQGDGGVRRVPVCDLDGDGSGNLEERCDSADPLP